MGDFAACLAMDRDPEVTKYIPGPWADPVQHERFLRERIDKPMGPGLGYWAICPRAQPAAFLGWILLIPYDGVGPEIEIGWRLVRRCWGRGYATEAALPVVSHAFATLGLARILADIDPRNVASQRIAEKIGMACVGEGAHGGAPCKSYVMTSGQYAAVATG